MDENKESLNVSDIGAHLPALDTGLSAEVKAGLVSALKNKTQSLAGQYSDVMENSNPKVKKRKRVELLREIQSQHDELKAKFFKERAALEAKYLKLYESLFTKRYEIVNGVVEVESVAKENAEETKTDDKGLPGFWLTAMKNNDVLTEKIQKRDEKALKFLKDIKWSRIDDPKGFKLEFFFNSNPYFKNSVLTKTYHIINNDKPPIGTEIEWYPGKCLTWKILKRTNARPIPEIKGCDSFFSFFSPLPAPEDDKYIARVLQQQIDEDYDIGCTIRDEIIPHAVSWFTGEAAQDNNFQDLVEDDDGEDNDEDEEEDDDDEEEDSKPKCLTGIYYMYAADMSSLEHHPSYQQIPRPPTWGGTGYDYYGQ